MARIDAGVVTRTYTQTIGASPDQVFLLLCPVREGEWLDGWAAGCRMIHSISGVAEEGCVFATAPEGGPQTVWVVTKHDPAAKIVEFVRVTHGLVATRLNIRVEAAGANQSRVHITYAHTPLTPAGAEFVATAHSSEAFLDLMQWWQKSMNHWLKTGEMLRIQS